MKKRVLLSFLLILCGAVVFFCQEVIEEIVVIVNDEIITLSQVKEQDELLRQMLRMQFQGEQYQSEYERRRRNLLNEMIVESLLLQEARRKEINVDEQMKLYIENMKKENDIESDAELFQIMRQQGADPEEWRKQLRESIMKEGVIFTEVNRNIVVDDSEVVGYYKVHSKEFKVIPEYKLKAISISAELKSEEEVEAKKREISEKIASGQDLAALASEYSDGPEKEKQGDLGTYKKGELEKNLEQAVEKLKVGEITPWLKMRNGWILLKLEEKKEERVKTYEEARKEIEQQLFAEIYQKKLNEFLNKLREQSYIKILKPNPLDIK